MMQHGVGVKVMPYSTTCSTPLSNFEAGQNYKEVVDPAIVVSFPLDEHPDVSLVAWTTTPWTLPSNLALCVNPELTYVKVRLNYINCDTRLITSFNERERYDGKFLNRYEMRWFLPSSEMHHKINALYLFVFFIRFF